MLRIDRSEWQMFSSKDGFLVRNYAGTVIADALSMEVGLQIVDEHQIVRRLLEVLRARDAAPLQVSREKFLEPPA